MARQLRVEIVGDASRLQRAFGQASGSASGFGSAITRMGKVAAVAAGVGFGAVAVGLKKAVSAAGEFEASLNTLQAVSGASGARMAEVSKLARDLGRDVSLPGTSAKDAAEAMTELAKGGLSVRQSMKAAKGVLQLSAAAQIGNAEAATIAARALNAFGLNGRQAGKVADVLANAANASTGEITDFAMGLQQSSAVAKQWGLSINETTAALMAMSDAGIVGSDAGTSLKTMLQSLIPATEPAANAMERLGVNVFDAKGKFVGIEETIRQYSAGLKGMTQEQQAATLKTIFGSDAVRAANIILGKGAEAFSEYVDKTERSGAAAELAAAKMKGYKGAMEAIKSSVETLQIEIGSQLLPSLTRAAEGVANFLGALSEAKGFEAKVRVVLDTAGDLAQKAIKVGQDIGGQIADALGKVNWAETGNTIARGIGEAFRRGIPVLAQFAATITEGFKKAIQEADWGTIGAAIGAGLRDGMKKAVRARFENGLNDALKDATLPQATITSVMGEVGAAIGKALGISNKKEVPKGMEPLPALVKAGIDPAIVAAMAGGGRIGSGLAGGLRAALSGVGASVASTIIAQIQMSELQIKQKYGIHSPSTVWAERIGKPLGQGIVQGMDGGLALLYPKAQARLAAFEAKLKAQLQGARDRLETAFAGLGDKLFRAFDAETSGHRTAAEIELDTIAARRAAEALQKALEDAMATGDPAAIARAQEDIRVAELERQAERERKAYEDQRATMRENLEKRLATLGAHFKKEGTTVSLGLAAIAKLMNKFGITFEEAGEYIGRSFMFGLQKAVGGAAAAAGGVKGAQTGGNPKPSPPIVTQVLLDGKVVAETVRKENAIYQRSNGAVVPA